jgi:uridine kinase
MGATITQVVKRSGPIVPFNPERITNAIYRAAVAVGGRDRATAERLTRQVVAILEENTPAGHIPHVEEIQDIVERVLIENGHARTAKAYILYRAERARRRGEKSERSQRGDGNVPLRKIYEVLNWAVDHSLHTVQLLNERIARGEFAAIVQESEQAYERDVDTAAQIIKERQDEVRIVIVAGPSSSGKTTTTIKLNERLAAMGLSLVALNVDNYFFDLELHPKDEYGDYDFETPQALDLALINEHLVRLLDGDEVRIPFYDFQKGTRTAHVTPMRLGPTDIVLIDSLHGLYGDMTRDIVDERKFRLYIETLLQMKDNKGKFVRWTDLRLMRRMVRDAQFRAYDPEQTLLHWHYVRSSELRNIIPHVNSADYVINSALPYELPIMKARLGHHFLRWSEEYANDPQRVDAAIRSQRVQELLSSIQAVSDESAIPAHSLLREFIGGSQYEY